MAAPEATEPVRAVLLDAFGTLVTMEAPGPHLRRELASRGIQVTEEVAAAAFSAEIRYYLAHHLEGRDAASLDDLRGRCAGVLAQALEVEGLALDTARAAMLASLRFSAFVDAAPALKALRERGLALVVVSNWDSSLGEVIDRTGLGGLVDGVVASADVGAVKPAPAVFAAALELAGAPPSHAVHVGDSPANDVVGAQAAGLRAVLMVRDDEVSAAVRANDVAGPYHHRTPTVGDLRELTSVI